MARKKSATVEYVKSKVWSISIRSSDALLLADLVGAIGAAENRGLQIINALPPFAGLGTKPRKAMARKLVMGYPEIPDVPGPGKVTGGGDSAVSRAIKMREGS